MDPARENKAHPGTSTSKAKQPPAGAPPRGRSNRATRDGASAGGPLGQLLTALRAARQGDFSVRLRFDPNDRAANGGIGKNGSTGKNGVAKNGRSSGPVAIGGGEPGVDPEVMRAIAGEFNAMVALNEALAGEMVRVERVVGREGRMTERVGLR